MRLNALQRNGIRFNRIVITSRSANIMKRKRAGDAGNRVF
jgi:hypothetical protein